MIQFKRIDPSVFHLVKDGEMVGTIRTKPKAANWGWALVIPGLDYNKRFEYQREAKSAASKLLKGETK
jgi:hypothetical protein